MSPQSRPFDEVAKDVYANEGNAMQPTHAETADKLVPGDLDHARREHSLLRYLVRIHQEAVVFYQTAAASTRYPSLEPQLRELEHLHRAINDNIGLRLRASSVLDDEDPAGGAQDAFLFGEMTYMLSSDLFPLQQAISAEEKTLHAMEVAAEEDISPDARLFLVEQAAALSDARNILDTVQILQER